MSANNHIELVEKAMRILEVLAQEGEPLELKDLTSRVGLVKSSVFRILYTLRELGYVEQRGRGTYGLTVKMFALARKAPARPALIDIAHPHLKRLRDALNEAAWLAEWRRGRVILIDVAESRQRLRLSLDIGDVCPLHASSLGKSVAAFLPPEELAAALGTRELPRFTPNTLGDRAILMEQLEKVRAQGYATNHEETIEGAFIVGAPLFDACHEVFAAISLSSPTVRCTPEKRASMIEAVKKTSTAITQELAELGYRARQ